MRLLIILTVLILTFCGCSSSDKKNKNNMGFFDKLFGKKDSANTPGKNTPNIDKTSQTYMDYQKKLLAAKEFYPFERWRNSYSNGLTQYTTQNCEKVKKVFDDLIAGLVEIGENASEEQKKELFKVAIIKTNKLNDELEGLIETGEREDLCELTDKITVACGLDPHQYGGGEGLASEWREW